ncbi:desmethyl-deoxy-podophyllotoxin synthase-like isoform X3 [Hordeum vulgare subsp. vulgare]|uniref:desmethyl-deoxy-podophyllotoxin synthase-like isoform X3 n=1 Tax=Hordeum vulgare subsp. vulgare TaxID=112509 RepID=UPI000B468243|nr:desmethyl-deoxy-podophyllotoxin synthase-like isoform X3 [Hordeum vulgare subsp. vulgare]
MQIIIMEEWLTFSLIALSTLLALGLFKLSGGKKQALPPGPWRLPIIGSLHHVVSILPHRTMTELCRRHGPMMYLQLGEIPTVVLSSKEAVGQMMKASDLQFTKRRITAMQDIVGFGGKGITFAPYGDHWRQMRKVCVTELLSSKQVRRMESVRAEEMGSLLRSMTASAGATVNFSQKVAALSNDVVARAVFGGKFSQQEDFIHASDRIMDLLGGFFLVDLFPSSRLVRWLSSEERRIQSSRDLMHRIITDVIDERKAVRAASNGGTCDEGLLDVLLTRQEEGSLESPLTTDMITTVLFDMFGAGTDTTSTTLEWAMSELVNHGEAMAKAQLEDPQYWNNPGVFNPERFENNNMDYNGTCFEFTPFGFGRRLCPGITFASSVLEMALANFLYHFDWVLPDGATSVDMSEKFGLIVRRSSDLHLRVIPHLCSNAMEI